MTPLPDCEEVQTGHYWPVYFDIYGQLLLRIDKRSDILGLELSVIGVAEGGMEGGVLGVEGEAFVGMSVLGWFHLRLGGVLNFGVSFCERVLI